MTASGMCRPSGRYRTPAEYRFRLAWELGEVLGCEDEILPQRDKDMSAGYVGAGEVCSEAAAFLLGLTGEAPVLHPAAGVCGLPELFTGGPGEGKHLP